MCSVAGSPWQSILGKYPLPLTDYSINCSYFRLFANLIFLCFIKLRTSTPTGNGFCLICSAIPAPVAVNVGNVTILTGFPAAASPVDSLLTALNACGFR